MNTGVGCHALLQGIFLVQGSNLHLLPALQVDSWLLAPPGKPGVEECFKIVTIGKFIAIIISSLQVNLSFSSAQGLPASNTSLKITAAPYSLCGLQAVDKSVLLMKPEAELSPQSVSPISVSDIRKCTHDMTISGSWKLYLQRTSSLECQE